MKRESIDPRCEPYMEALAAGAPGPVGMERHLASCRDCRAFAEDVDRLAGLARDLPGSAPRGGVVADAPGLRWRGLALAAALLLACGVVVWGLTRDTDGPEPRGVEVADTGRQPDLFAALDRARAVWSPRAAAWTDWLELPETGARAGYQMELLEGAFEPRDLTLTGGGER